MKRILIFDANQRSALATTRSLGKHGVTVMTADETHEALAGCSKYSGSYFHYPAPASNPDDFIAFISKLVNDQRIDILLPMTELTTALLLESQHRFPSAIIPCPDLDTINTISDKCSLMRIADSAGIPIPATQYLDHTSASNINLKQFNYPAVIKPGKSWLIDESGNWTHTSVHFANNPKQAKEIIDTDPALRAYPFMLQECINGTGQGVFAIYNHGKAIGFFSHRRLREKPPWGGVSVLSESVEVSPVLLKHTKWLLDNAKWHGIAMVEFKVADDGRPYLMEINTRFWGSLQLAIDSGVDFPWLLYQLSNDVSITPVTQYQTGRRLRWIMGDLDSLYLILKNRRYKLTEKLRSIIRFITPAPFKTRHEVNRLSDLKPFWWELKQYINDLLVAKK